jgi:hypothetical protein
MSILACFVSTRASHTTRQCAGILRPALSLDEQRDLLSSRMKPLRNNRKYGRHFRLFRRRLREAPHRTGTFLVILQSAWLLSFFFLQLARKDAYVVDADYSRDIIICGLCNVEITNHDFGSARTRAYQRRFWRFIVCAAFRKALHKRS